MRASACRTEEGNDVETFPQTVRIGGMDRDALRAELERAGVALNEFARVLLSHPGFTTSARRSDLAIAVASVGELGFAHGATIDEAFARAATRGMAPCPLEVAPHLRLQFLDQPEGYWGMPVTEHRAPPGSLTIAAHPLTADDAVPMGFYLRRMRGVPWLRGYRSPAEHVWSAEDRFVFRRG